MPEPIHEQVRIARSKQHLSQTKLGKRVGCSQSAISQFESGDGSALSTETLTKVQRVLGLLEATPQPDVSPSVSAATDALVFCANHDCPAALTVVIEGALAIRPVMYRLAGGSTAAHCKRCGSQLEHGCRKCVTDLVEDSTFCAGCGEPLVSIPSDLKPADLEEHAEFMARRLTFYRETRSEAEPLPRAELRNAGDAQRRRKQ